MQFIAVERIETRKWKGVPKHKNSRFIPGLS
jgi:hypothetical protein